MVDTLKPAKDLREGQVFTGEQAERLAGAIAQAGDDKRVRDLDVRLGVLTWIAGLQLAVALAVLWQLFALRGEVSALGADTAARLGAVEQRLGGVEQRLGGTPARPPTGPGAP